MRLGGKGLYVAGHRGVNGRGKTHHLGGGMAANLAGKGRIMSIARTSPAVGSRRHARTGGQRKMSGRLFGYARVSVASDADANNLENQR